LASNDFVGDRAALLVTGYLTQERFGQEKARKPMIVGDLTDLVERRYRARLFTRHRHSPRWKQRPCDQSSTCCVTSLPVTSSRKSPCTPRSRRS